MNLRFLAIVAVAGWCIAACGAGPASKPLASAAPAGETAQALQEAGWPAVTLTPLVSGLDEPLFLTGAGDGSGRLFIVEKKGRIKVLAAGASQATVFLDITDRVGSDGSEQGLLGLAFEPNSGGSRFWVDYTKKAGCKGNGACDTVIAQYQAADGDPNHGNASSEAVALTIDQPYPNHNGGMLAFGPNGLLYIGMGDGGSAGDPQNRAQNPNSQLGKILELTTAAGGGAPVVRNFALGLRNPWRFSFDKETGDVFIADVGQDKYEEVDRIPAGSSPPLNFGWNVREGDHCFKAASCPAFGEPPIAEYGHSEGCSITGGYVYRGAKNPALSGVYFYGDYCSGRLWGLRSDGSGGWQHTELLRSGRRISSFGQDDQGELYLVDLGGSVYRVEQGAQRRSQFRIPLPLVVRDG